MLSITEHVISSTNFKDNYIFNLIKKIKDIRIQTVQVNIKRGEFIDKFVEHLNSIIIDIKQEVQLTLEKSILNFNEFDATKESFNREILELTHTIAELEQELEIEKSKESFINLQKNIIEKIFSIPFMKSTECSICLNYGIIVDLKISCRNIDPLTGRPFCEGLLCLTCARQVLGLSLDRHTYHEVKCPTCRQTSRRPANASEGYSINMGLLRAADSYLTYEDEIFKKTFNMSLNAIECQKCNSRFDTLSNLHHHMRADPGHIPCPESKVVCTNCRILTVRSNIINDKCTNCV